MPEALLDFLGYRFFFYSNEFVNQSEGRLEPIHIHVTKKSGGREAKFWLLSDGSVSVAENGGLSDRELSKLSAYIRSNRQDAISAWMDHFEKGELKRI